MPSKDPDRDTPLPSAEGEVFPTSVTNNSSTETVVKECPECDRRVLMDVPAGQKSPVTRCDCGTFEVMKVVEQ